MRIPDKPHMWPHPYTPCARIRLSVQLFILLSPVAPSAYADCRRQSSDMLNFQGQRKHSSQSRKRPKVTEGRRVGTYADVYRRIRSPVIILYFYPRRNLRYAVATRRQPAWTSAPPAGAYARMEYKPGLMLNIDGFFVVNHDKLLNKQSSGRWSKAHVVSP